MSQELLYTSAPHGLKPGSRGFCTVLSTQGMAAPLASALEGLSGYRPVFPPGDEQHDLNPITWSHVTMAVAGRTSHILSRVAEYGLDYSQRTNKLAHHVVLDSGELITAGPAALLRSNGFMRDEWNEEPHLTPTKPVPPIPPRPPGVCQAWKDLTGDGGWAGVLAESFLRDAERPVILLYAPGQDMLPLIAEALSLIPANRRWEVTFTTYFTGLPQTVNCNWRCMLADSPEAHQSLRLVRALRLDLTDPDRLGMPAGNELVADARGVPRLKTGSQGSLPPLPLAGGTDSFDEHTAPEMASDGEVGDVPPLPGSSVYPVQPPRKSSSKKQQVGQLSNAAAEMTFVRRRKLAAVIGGVGLVVLLLIGIAIGITRSARNRPKHPSPDQSHQQANAVDVEQRVVESRIDSQPIEAEAANSQPKPADEKPLALPANSKLTLSAPSNKPSPPTSPEKQIPAQTQGPSSADDSIPSDNHANIDIRKKRDQSLLSIHANQNPFLSITLFSPESVHLSGETKPFENGFHFEIKVKGSLVDSPFIRISSQNSAIANDNGRFQISLSMDLIGDYQSQIGRLDWCEIDVQNRNPHPPVTRIRFHDFPLDDAKLKVKFKNEKDGLQATWDLGVVAETNVPEMQMTHLLVTFGSTEYRFVLAPLPSTPKDDVIATFQSPDLKSALIKVLKDIDEAKIANSFTINLKKASSSADDSSRKPVALTLHMEVGSQLEKALSITPMTRAAAKSSCENANSLLNKVGRNTIAKNSILDFNKGSKPAEVATKVETALSRLKTHNEWLSSVSGRNDGEKQLLVATNAAVQTALEKLNELKQRCEEIARFEQGMEQIAVKSADLHYSLDSPNGARRPVFIFKTSGE